MKMGADALCGKKKVWEHLPWPEIGRPFLYQRMSVSGLESNVVQATFRTVLTMVELISSISIRVGGTVKKRKENIDLYHKFMSSHAYL